MTFVPRNYTDTLTDKKTWKLSNMHDLVSLSAGNYYPSMGSLLPVVTYQTSSCMSPSFSSFSLILSLFQCTYTGGVIALSRRERGHPQSRTNVQKRMCRVWRRPRERLQSGASITIIILPHLKRWLLQQLLWKGEDKERQVGRKRDERRKNPLMTVSKSKA